jgi:hypothetical protein
MEGCERCGVRGGREGSGGGRARSVQHAEQH